MSVLNVRPIKMSFKTECVPDVETSTSDDILSRGINLDEADRFIASLRIPSRKTLTASNAAWEPTYVTSVDFSTFHAETEKLERLRFAGIKDPSEDDDDSNY
jgi:hypothetical protein